MKLKYPKMLIAFYNYVQMRLNQCSMNVFIFSIYSCMVVVALNYFHMYDHRTKYYKEDKIANENHSTWFVLLFAIHTCQDEKE